MPLTSPGKDFYSFQGLGVEISLGARQKVKICNVARRNQQEVKCTVQTKMSSLKVFQIPRMLYT